MGVHNHGLALTWLFAHALSISSYPATQSCCVSGTDYEFDWDDNKAAINLTKLGWIFGKR